ncbi:LacI family DNA-binding transcriptional regulator [Bacillus sp. FJAT-28004]|uniref:LacI family DNA-binding transcriptional regulator n=1 Tax=Bacillus sp. FJAT-28004 TaxID=1679165 RepID=UPI0006B4F551|nr:LacI family DNA-binding transcriptional regulator [Bacillus sp. FJAT-28004]
MKKNYTTTDIANMLGLSRNTVSKALNNHPSISEETIKIIVDKARSLGYKKYKLNPPDTKPEPKNMKNIAFLSYIDVFHEGYWGDVMKGAEESLRQSEYNMVFNFVQLDDLPQLTLPQTLLNGNIDGIILTGFPNKAYSLALADLKIPLVLIDSHSEIQTHELMYDIVLMESDQSVCELTHHLIKLGHREIGFIGNIHRCKSFMDRWLGFKRSMDHASLPVNFEYCIIDSDPTNHTNNELLISALKDFKQYPTAFICMNDIVAWHVINYLQSIGLQVPGDVSVTGFDHSKFFSNTAPIFRNLTTVEVQGRMIGARAIDQLLWRMQHRDRPHEIIHISTKPIYGETTAAPKQP